MVQRLRFIGVAVLSVLVLTIVGAVSISPAYAGNPPTMTLNISPNPALPNQPVTFSGKVSPPATSADTIEVLFAPAGTCITVIDIRFIPLAVGLAPSALTPLKFPILTGTADSSGFYSITAPSGFSAGGYTATAQDTSYAAVIVVSPCDSFAVAPPIPEYPLGVAILALFMVIAYGFVRRRTRYDHA